MPEYRSARNPGVARGWMDLTSVSEWERRECQEEFLEGMRLGTEGWVEKVGSGLGSPLLFLWMRVPV